MEWLKHWEIKNVTASWKSLWMIIRRRFNKILIDMILECVAVQNFSVEKLLILFPQGIRYIINIEYIDETRVFVQFARKIDLCDTI